MIKQDITDQIKLKTTELQITKEPNKRRKLENQIKILKLKLEIERIKEIMESQT